VTRPVYNEPFQVTVHFGMRSLSDSISTTKPTSRVAARDRKRKQRERDRARAAVSAELLAAQQEQMAEELAPAVLRNPIVRPDGSVLRGAKISIVDGRPERALPLIDRDVVGDLHSRSPQMTDRLKRAARLLQADVSEVGGGVNVNPANWAREGVSGGSSDGSGAHAGLLRQVACQDRLRGAAEALGAHGDGVSRVVIDGLSVAAWSAESGLEPAVALAWVLQGLSKLANYYWPANDNKHGITSVAVSGMAAAS
jgi:hypothetical protein